MDDTKGLNELLAYRALKADLKECEKSCYGGQELIDQLRADLARVTAERDGLAQELEKWMQGSARLQEKYDKLITDLASARAEVQRLGFDLAHSYDKYKYVQESNDRLRATLEDIILASDDGAVRRIAKDTLKTVRG